MYRNLIYILMLLIIPVAAFSKVDTVRIGYFESGDYFMHKITYREISRALERFKGDSLEFLYEPTAYKTAGWDRDRSRSMARDLTRIKKIDMVFAAGPWTIKDLIAAGFDRPIIGIYQFDSEVTGLLNSDLTPVYNNLTLAHSPDKLANDLDVMNRLFPTKRLGILYFPEDDEFREMIAKTHELAGVFGAAVFSSEKYNNDSVYSHFKSFSAIRGQAKAIYLPPMWGLNNEQINQFLAELFRARIPAFSSEGFLIVEKGAAAANSTHNYKGRAQFLAYHVLQIINGARPADLSVIYKEFPAISLNLDQTQKMGHILDRNYIINAKTIPPTPTVNVPQYTLKAAVEQATLENSDIFIWEQRLSTAIARADYRGAEYYPQLDLTFNAALAGNEPEVAAYESDYNRQYHADLTLTQPLLSARLLGNLKIARQRTKMEELNRDQFLLELKHTVTQAYLEILAWQAVITGNEELVDHLREYLVLAQVNAQLGLNDTLDIYILEEELVKAKIKSHTLKNKLTTAQIIFNVLIGRPGDIKVVLDNSEFAMETVIFLSRQFESYIKTDSQEKKFKEFLVNVGINNSLGMSLAESEIELAEMELSAVSKWYLPEVNLKGKYSIGKEFDPHLNSRDDFWFIGGSLSLPLFDMQRMKREKSILQNRLDHYQINKDKIRFENYERIEIAGGDFVTQLSILPMRYFVNSSSTSNRDNFYTMYLTGRLSIHDLLRQERSYYESVSQLNNSRHLLFFTYSEMLASIGYEYLYQGTGNQKAFFDRFGEYMDN